MIDVERSDKKRKQTDRLAGLSFSVSILGRMGDKAYRLSREVSSNFLRSSVAIDLASDELRDFRSAKMILSQLPTPTREHTRVTPEKPAPSSRALSNVGTAVKEPPPYGTAERREYKPRRQEDFGDGGQDPAHNAEGFSLSNFSQKFRCLAVEFL